MDSTDPTGWTAEPLTLEGSIVRLEPLAIEHVAALCEVGLDPELWRWTISDVRTPADMRRYVENALALRAGGTGYPFVTIERASGRVIGSTRYHAIEPAHRRVEIGYTFVARAWQRTALNSEAKYLMLRHAFESLGMHRVEFKTDVLNERSRKALLGIGATEEGVLRAHAVTESGRIRDTIYFSVLAPEWPSVKKALESRLARTGHAGRNSPDSMSSTSTRPSSMT